MRIGPRHHDLAGLDRLAQGFQHRAGKFGKLVHEQNAVMRQRDFARPRTAPAADDCCHRGGMMRLAERARARDAVRPQQTGQRMHHRGLKRLGRRHRRQDRGQARGQHRLAGTRRPDKQHVMTPGSGDFQRPLGALLAFHLRQIAQAGLWLHLARLGRGKRRLAGKMPDHRRQRRRRQHPGGRNPRGLAPAGARADQSALLLGGGHGSRQRPGHRHQRTIQRKLPQRHGFLDHIARQHVDCRQQRQRDRQVEMRALLGHVGRRQVDGDFP